MKLNINGKDYSIKLNLRARIKINNLMEMKKRLLKKLIVEI